MFLVRDLKRALSYLPLILNLQEFYFINGQAYLPPVRLHFATRSAEK